MAFHDFVVAAAGAPDVLINNAGLGYMKPLEEISDAEIETTLDVNEKGLLRVTKSFLPELKRTKGNIFNIASDVGRRPVGGISTYVGSKHGVVGISNALTRELKTHGIRVTAFLPGSIQTSFDQVTRPGAAPNPDAMSAIDAARAITCVLDLPKTIVVDEMTFHPLAQIY